MRDIIDGFVTLHCFARWNNKPEFDYLGIGKVINYNDNFNEVYESDGSRTFCIEFELSCKEYMYVCDLTVNQLVRTLNLRM